MFRALAAMAVAAASTNSNSVLTSGTPWWERVVVTVTDDGQTQSCRYESSLRPALDCSVVRTEATKASSSSKSEYTRITFERRFSPGSSLNAPAPQAGETLLGGRVMALAIDARGAVKNCRVVSTSGSLAPQYGCDEASAERFDASAVSAHPQAVEREGYMTILVYGHSEHVI